MASEKIKIDKDLLRTVVDRIKSGKKTDNHIYTDLGSSGLELRIQGSKVAWVIRYKKLTKTFGFAHPTTHRAITTISEAREVHKAVRALIDDNPERIEPFLGNYFTSRVIRDAFDYSAQVLADRVQVVTWTLRECLDNMITQRTRADIEKALRPSSIRDIRTTLSRPEFADVIDKPVVLLSRGTAEYIRNEVDRRCGVSPGKKVVSNLRTILTYSAKYHSGQSGLERADPWWLMLSSDKVVRERTRCPDLAGIGKTLALCDKYLDEPLPGRSGVQHGLRDNVYAAFLWIILSAQRQGSGLALRADYYYPDPKQPGWYLAAWDADDMKGKRAFVLPIPPRMVAVLKAAKDRARHAGKSEWAFPSEDSPDLHVDRSATLGVLKRLGARDDFAKHNPRAIDLLLLNGIGWWSPHDTRRTVTKALDDAGIPGGASALLAHSVDLSDKGELSERTMTEEQRDEWHRQRVALITQRAYGGVQHIKLKSAAMLVWSDAVLDAYDLAKTQTLIIENPTRLAA